MGFPPLFSLKGVMDNCNFFLFVIFAVEEIIIIIKVILKVRGIYITFHTTVAKVRQSTLEIHN